MSQKMENLQKEYESVRPEVQQFSEDMKRELEKMFSRKSLTLGIPLQTRVKEWDSIAEKIEKKELVLTSINQLADLVGIRAIFLFKRDMTKACKLVEKTFNVISREDTAKRLDEKEFGYQSIHYIVKPPHTWLTVPSFEGLSEYKLEIQLRTLAQHIWASASHQLQYKHEESVPQPIRRTIHRASALLETVDLEFERVLKEREQYLKKIDFGLDEPLNVDVLARVLDKMLPAINKNKPESYADLLSDLKTFDVHTTNKLLALINKHLQKALARDSEKVNTLRSAPKDKMKNRTKKGVYFSRVGLIRIIMRAEYGDKWRFYRFKKQVSEHVAAKQKKKPT